MNPKYILVWLLVLIAMSVIDSIWHLGIFGKQYKEGLKLLGENYNKILLVIVQVVFVTALVVLVLYTADGYLKATIVGALGGILAITVYGLTNYLIIRDWNLTMTILEVIWGPILGAISGLITWWFKSLLI